MAEERVDIVVSDLVAPTIAIKLDKIATAAHSAHSQVKALAAASVVLARTLRAVAVASNKAAAGMHAYAGTSARAAASATTASAAASSQAETAFAAASATTALVVSMERSISVFTAKAAATVSSVKALGTYTTALAVASRAQLAVAASAREVYGEWRTLSAAASQMSIGGSAQLLLGPGPASGTGRSAPGRAVGGGGSGTNAMASMYGSSSPKAVDDALKKTAASADKAKKSFIGLGTVLRTMFMAYFAVAAAQRILTIADTYRELHNRLLLVTDSGEQASDVFDAIFMAAQRSRTGVEAMVRSFQRFDLALATAGRSQQETLQLTETVAMMMQLTGSTATEASSGMLQLSQAFNKGKLDGDEFRTVMETMPMVSKAFADQLKVSKKEMYSMAEAGELTADMLTDVLLKSTEDVRREFDRLDTTLGHAVTTLQNELIDTFGELNEELGGTAGLASVIDNITDSIDGFVMVLQSLITVWSSGELMFGQASHIFDPIKNAFTDIAEAIGLVTHGLPDMKTLIVFLGKFAEIDRLNKDGASATAILAKIQDMKKLVDLGLDGYIAAERKLKETFKGREKGDPIVEARDLTALIEFIARLKSRNEIFKQEVYLRDNNVALLRLEQQLKRDGTELEPEERVRLHRMLNEHEARKRLHVEEMQIYDDTIIAQQVLLAHQEALTGALHGGYLGVLEYRGAWAATEAELLRVNDIMGATADTLGTSLRLSMLQLAAELPLVMQTIADTVTDAFQRMSDGVGDLVAQWALFGDAMRFIDVFRMVIAQMISSLVSLATQYIIVGIARQFAMPGVAPSSRSSISQVSGSEGFQSAQGFYNGGYTGGVNKNAIAGLVHGQEFVVNARATAKNRGALEAMNSGGSAAPNIIINNNAVGVAVRTEYVSKDEVRIICEETVSKKSGTAIARDMGNPNSAVSRSMRSNTNAGRKGI